MPSLSERLAEKERARREAAGVVGIEPTTSDKPATDHAPVAARPPVTSAQPTGGEHVTGSAPDPSRVLPPTVLRPVAVAQPTGGEHVTGGQPVGQEPTTPVYPNKDGYLRLPNTILYSVFPTLKMEQRVVYEELYAATHGFGENPRRVSRKQLCVRLSTDEKRLRRIIKALEAKGLIRVVDEVRGGANESRGTVFWVWSPEVMGDQPATSKRPATGRVPVAGRAPAHEREEKERHERPAAVAPAIDVFGVRTIAARLFEVHRSELGFNHERLRQLVRDALIGQGTTPDAELVDEAIRGMAE